MTTSELITLALRELGAGWTREAIRDLVNRCQNEILGENLNLMRIKPDPFLTTSAGTYAYTANSSLYASVGGTKGTLISRDVRRVAGLFSFDRTVNLFNLGTIDPASQRPNQVEWAPTTEVVHAAYDEIPSIEPLDNACTVTFWEGNDPGTTETVWRAVAYCWPTQVLTEDVALSIPADFQDTLLMYRVLMKAHRRNYGRLADWYELNREATKAFRKKYNDTVTLGVTHNTPPREL